ncbi:hypothetical protein QVD17_09382 [Tagetes erecta]|uniref:Uncharacterized protein n=1 Tax=Tagetes erecta TaxID=13708 RepID=A0AAD8KZ81_TARER|nr:hypothetical protein QVD17_09382 [Tagetes erecta]
MSKLQFWSSLSNIVIKTLVFSHEILIFSTRNCSRLKTLSNTNFFYISFLLQPKNSYNLIFIIGSLAH